MSKSGPRWRVEWRLPLRSEKSLWVGAFCGKGVHLFRTDRGDDEAVVELVGEER
jgi:hypothetical protein